MSKRSISRSALAREVIRSRNQWSPSELDLEIAAKWREIGKKHSIGSLISLSHDPEIVKHTRKNAIRTLRKAREGFDDFPMYWVPIAGRGLIYGVYVALHSMNKDEIERAREVFVRMKVNAEASISRFDLQVEKVNRTREMLKTWR